MALSSTWRAAGLLLGVLLLAPVSHAQDTSPGGPTFANIASNCNAYHTVVAGDGCWSITQTYSITLDQFYLWNPDVTDDCGTNFWPGYAYCVGVGPAPPASLSSTPVTCSCSTISTGIVASSSTASSSTKSSTTSASGTGTSGTTSSSISSNTEPYTTLHPITNYTITPTTVASVFPPTRIQAGQPADCIDWYLTTSWDTCDSIVASNSWLTKEKLCVISKWAADVTF